MSLGVSAGEARLAEEEISIWSYGILSILRDVSLRPAGKL
jgi:hypothetical protein